MPPIITPVALYQPAETWYWNGLALSQPYWNIATFGGSRSGVPTLRGQDYQVPYRAGQGWRAKYPDERTMSLTMWLDGSGSSAGWPSSDAHLAFNNNWQAVRQAFFTRNAGGSVQGQLTRNWWLTHLGAPQMVTSIAMAEIAGSMDLTMNGRTGAAFTTDLLLADPYFYGPQRVQAISGSGVINAYGEGVVGEGFSSPVAGLQVTLSAPATVSNVSQGISFTVSSGPSFPVTVHCLTYSVVDNAGANQAQAFSHQGSRLWMALANGANTITVSAGTATFQWNDAYI
jgi:hypothetical protein